VLWLFVRHMCELWCGEAERVEFQVQPEARKRPTTRELAGGVLVLGEPGGHGGPKKFGAVAKWQGMGLQNPHRRFDSASRLQIFCPSWEHKRLRILFGELKVYEDSNVYFSGFTVQDERLVGPLLDRF
jgi:hypothetical protein